MDGVVSEVRSFFDDSSSSLGNLSQSVNGIVSVGFGAFELGVDGIGEFDSIAVGIVGLSQNDGWEVGGACVVDADGAILVIVAEECYSVSRSGEIQSNS
jgi:hypothetical protein